MADTQNSSAIRPPVPLAGGVSTIPSADSGWKGLPTPPTQGQHVTTEPPTFVDLSSWLRESPPWLVSAILHMLVIIGLGLWFVREDIQAPFLLDAKYSEDLGDQLLEDSLNLEEATEIQIDEQLLTPDVLPPVDDPLALPDLAMLSPAGNLVASQQDSTTVGIALTGREPGMKQALLKAYGGTVSTERAVMEGLRWLARNQKSDGSWSLKGPYRDGANVENTEAATAMALLAFQGAGYTHKKSGNSPFTSVVLRGWNALSKSTDENGCFFRHGARNHTIYTHAQCTIAICELFAMTRDESYRDLAQAAVDFLVRSQATEGGWRYTPGEGSDLSVTGWAVMALQSARMAGLEVPSETFARIGGFLDSVQRAGGSQYAYMVRDGATASMTAEGLLCRQYLGWGHEDGRLRQGVYYLLDNLPEWRRGKRNVYYWYYGTQVCHHMEGEYWRRWNAEIRQILPENQEDSGKERGSWDPDGDRWGDAGGRLFVTCLSIYTLEVYYRHLPIYQQDLLKGGF